MIYRALADLGIGKKIVYNGAIFPGGWLKPEAVIILNKQDKIAPANLPPLAALPRWQSSAAKLAKAGIANAGEFLEADDSALAGVLKITIPEVQQSKREMFAMFNPPPRQG